MRPVFSIHVSGVVHVTVILFVLPIFNVARVWFKIFLLCIQTFVFFVECFEYSIVICAWFYLDLFIDQFIINLLCVYVCETFRKYSCIAFFQLYMFYECRVVKDWEIVARVLFIVCCQILLAVFSFSNCFSTRNFRGTYTSCSSDFCVTKLAFSQKFFCRFIHYITDNL